MQDPEGKLWRGPTRHMEEVRTVFNHLKSLNYEDKPNYGLVRDCLRSILQKNQSLPRAFFSIN
jgi:hypothetical protein